VSLTQERLKELLDYSPENGEFVWKVQRAGNAKVGQRAGTCYNGYISIKVDLKLYPAHRLAWLYVYGCFPEKPLVIDHIDRNPSNNRICNLRAVTQVVNQYNRPSRGTAPHKNKWQARLKKGDKLLYLGLYDTEEEAHNVYLRAKAAATEDSLNRP
jgi:hypothetical protein